MTKKLLKRMPKFFKKCFLYKRIYWDVYLHNKNAGLIVVGQTGSGKSYVAQRIAEDLDPTFTVSERVVYSAQDFLALLAGKKLVRGNVIIFDEIVHEEGADSRSSLSRTNKIMTYVASVYRALGLIVIFVLPSLTQLDKNLRAISVLGIIKTQSIDYERKLCRCKFYWNDLNPMFGKAYLKRASIVEDFTPKKVKFLLFGKPSQKIVEEYEAKKRAFVDENIGRWSAKFNTWDAERDAPKKKRVSFDELMKDVKLHRSELELKGRVLPSLIMQKYGVGIGKAKELARSAYI